MHLQAQKSASVVLHSTSGGTGKRSANVLALERFRGHQALLPAIPTPSYTEKKNNKEWSVIELSTNVEANKQGSVL